MSEFHQFCMVESISSGFFYKNDPDMSWELILPGTYGLHADGERFPCWELIIFRNYRIRCRFSGIMQQIHESGLLISLNFITEFWWIFSYNENNYRYLSLETKGGNLVYHLIHIYHSNKISQSVYFHYYFLLNDKIHINTYYLPTAIFEECLDLNQVCLDLQKWYIQLLFCVIRIILLLIILYYIIHRF